MPGDLTIDTNGAVVLSHGDLSADRIVVQGLTAVPVPPGAVVGLFQWVDGAGPSSLTADQILVRAGGQFVHDSLTGTMSVNRLTVEAGGAALLETGPTFLQRVSNGGYLDLGDRFFGNPVTIGAGGYTQDAAGQLRLLLGGGAGDVVDTAGGATLDGQLLLALAGGYTPTLGDAWVLLETDGGVGGTFATINGVVLDAVLGLAVTYDPTTVDAEVAYLGDANVDGAVGLADLSLLGSHWNQPGTWADGDFNGDGMVTLADLSLLGGNWGTGGSGAAMSFADAVAAVTFVPEPGSLAVLLLGGLGLVRRGQRAA